MSWFVAFRVVEPQGPRIPVIVEIPHASLRLDPIAAALLTAPIRAMVQDADLFVDELFEQAPALGATLLVAEISRYVCDLNRSPTDVDSLSVMGATGTAAPHGLVWRLTTGSQTALQAPIPRTEYERRIITYHEPYHRTLTELVGTIRNEFGFAILLCAHSMPSQGRSPTSDAVSRRADVVPGSRGGTTTNERVLGVPERLARDYGLTLRHDDPYRGGYSTGRLGQPNTGQHALQIELSRATYMDETSLMPHAGFDRMKGFCGELVSALGSLRLR